jgi:hypothetical protein
MKETNFYRYLSYAIGEILLVVIGILIALQVNNWNQNRLDKRKSIEYHQRMVNDLDQTISFLEDVFNFSKQVKDSIDLAVEILESGRLSISSRKTLNYALGNFFRLARNLPELVTYIEMENSGQLNLIYDTNLRKEIAAYLVNWKLVSTVSEDLNQKVNHTEFIDSYVKFSKESTFQNTVLEFDFEDLTSDKKVINVLSRYSFHWKTKMAFMNILSKNAKELKALIEQELVRIR